MVWGHYYDYGLMSLFSPTYTKSLCFRQLQEIALLILPLIAVKPMWDRWCYAEMSWSIGLLCLSVCMCVSTSVSEIYISALILRSLPTLYILTSFRALVVILLLRLEGSEMRTQIWDSGLAEVDLTWSLLNQNHGWAGTPLTKPWKQTKYKMSQLAKTDTQWTEQQGITIRKVRVRIWQALRQKSWGIYTEGGDKRWGSGVAIRIEDQACTESKDNWINKVVNSTK